MSGMTMFRRLMPLMLRTAAIRSAQAGKLVPLAHELHVGLLECRPVGRGQQLEVVDADAAWRGWHVAARRMVVEVLAIDGLAGHAEEPVHEQLCRSLMRRLVNDAPRLW